MPSAHLVGLTLALLQIGGARLESLQSSTQCLTLENYMPPGDWLEVQNVFPFPISTEVGAVDILDAIDIREYRRSGMNMCLKYSHDGDDVTHAASVKSKIIDAYSAGVYRILTVVDLDQPSVVRVVEGQGLKLTCSATGHPIPNVELDWVQNRTLSSAHEGVPGSVTGTILSAQSEHAGLYTCRAENDHVRVNQQVKLVVVPNRSASPPKISREQASTVWRTEGARVELTCKATGVPVPFIDWSGGSLFSGKRGQPGRVTGIFESVTLGNSGDYTCTAENEAGISTVHQRLRVQSKQVCVPPLPGPPGSVPAPMPPGCPPGPPTFFSGCRPGEPLGPDCNTGYGAYGGPVLPSYTADMSGLPGGPGVWPGQPVGPPVPSPELPSPPSISFDKSFVYTVTEGEDVQITCSADGSPSPRVAWIYPIQLPTASSQSTSDTSVTATVLNVTGHNVGAYYCSAENSVGTAVAWINLLVESRDEVARREPLIICPPGLPPSPLPPLRGLPCPPPGPPGSPMPPHCRVPGPPTWPPRPPRPNCLPGAPGDPPICGPPSMPGWN